MTSHEKETKERQKRGTAGRGQIEKTARQIIRKTHNRIARETVVSTSLTPVSSRGNRYTD